MDEATRSSASSTRATCWWRVSTDTATATSASRQPVQHRHGRRRLEHRAGQRRLRICCRSSAGQVAIVDGRREILGLITRVDLLNYLRQRRAQ